MNAPLILVAEDDPDQCEMLSNSLMDAGYQVVALRNGHDVLVHLEKLNPILVIMDIRMPGVDGMQILKDIRMSAKFSALAVILVSAYYSEVELNTLMELGASSTLSKPYEMEDLLAEVRRFVDAAQAQESFGV